MRISDWSSDVCSSDLDWLVEHAELPVEQGIAVTRVGRREDGTDVRAIAVHGATGIGAGALGVASRSRQVVGLVMIDANTTADHEMRTELQGIERIQRLGIDRTRVG